MVDNRSTEDTVQVAESMGARVVIEPRQGYGAAVHTVWKTRPAILSPCSTRIVARARSLGLRVTSNVPPTAIKAVIDTFPHYKAWLRPA